MILDNLCVGQENWSVQIAMRMSSDVNWLKLVWWVGVEFIPRNTCVNWSESIRRGVSPIFRLLSYFPSFTLLFICSLSATSRRTRCGVNLSVIRDVQVECNRPWSFVTSIERKQKGKKRSRLFRMTQKGATVIANVIRRSYDKASAYIEKHNRYKADNLI